MKEQTLVHKPLPQNPDIWVSVPDYKEPILPVTNGFGWYGLQAYDFQGNKLMCHECGGFYDRLSYHIKRHNITAKEYKNKYLLYRRKSLLSKKARMECSESSKMKGNSRDRMLELQKLKGTNKGGTPKGQKSALAIKNKNDTCPLQILRRLEYISKTLNKPDITERECFTLDSALFSAIRNCYGTFNKAKQIAKLASNPNFTEGIPKQLVLEDIIAFYRKNHRYPTHKDYKNGQMICAGQTVLNKFKGLKGAIREAQQLKDEQGKRNNININAIASRIELEYAGRARG